MFMLFDYLYEYMMVLCVICREELGYKVVCEQVSHHPPVSAFHVTATDYRVHGAINPKLKFWGKSVEITPKGITCRFCSTTM